MLRVYNPRPQMHTHRQAIRQRVQRRRSGQGLPDSGAARRLAVEEKQASQAADPASDAALVERLAARIAEHMSGSEVRTPSPDLRNDRMISLKEVLESCVERNRNACTEASWSGYRTLVAKWTRFWCGRGPDLRFLTAEHIQEFFEGVEEWKSERSWRKNADLLFALLKSACPLTVQNTRGMKEDAWLSIERLPVWSPPRDRWFRDRAKEYSDKESRGGHRRCSLPLLTVQEFSQILDACKGAEFLDPLWWEVWFCQLWYHGPRWQDFWRYQWGNHDLQADLRVDLHSATIHVTETKAGGNGTCPMPSWLRSRFAKLRSAQQAADGERVYLNAVDQPESEYRLNPGDAQNRERRWRAQYLQIWESAGVPVRNPHQMRGVAISYWIKHAPIYRFAAIGHAPPKGDTQLRNYATFDADFQRAAEAFPFPESHR